MYLLTYSLQVEIIKSRSLAKKADLFTSTVDLFVIF